jgi:hypothetical protein
MTTFLLDLWQDLRAKRLWPVAVALVVATLAVPLVLSKSASAPPPATGAGADTGASKLPRVALDASSIDTSQLDVFGQKNPFAPNSDKTVTAGAPSGPAVTPSGPAQPSGTGSGPTPSSSVGASTSSSTSTSSGSGSGSSGESGGSSTGSEGKPVTPGVHYFTYTADVRFGKRNHVKSYKGISELDVLPNGNNPIIAFMGVKNGDTAMFFIADPAFQAAGEGHCQPTRRNCMFVYLKTDGAHNEETLSAQSGQVKYTLILTGLHVKTLSQSQAVGSTTPAKSGSRAKQSAQASKAARLRAEEHATLLAMPALGVTSR